MILINKASWEIRSPGVLGLVGTEHVTIILDPTKPNMFGVHYKNDLVNRHMELAGAKAFAMILPALLEDFGMDT